MAANNPGDPSALPPARPSCLSPWRPGIWQFRLGPRSLLLAGAADRSCNVERLRAQLPFARDLIQAQHVHGASIAAINPFKLETRRLTSHAELIAGCDALATHTPGLALLIRTADCLPIFLWDPIQRVIGLAHVGWRGLVAQLPVRLVGWLRTRYQSEPGQLWAGIGPGIRACCYEVGPEFEPMFGAFVSTLASRRVCDLPGCATAQLAVAGVRRARVLDCEECTACHTERWYSLRKEGEQGGRVLSFMVIRP